MPRAATIPSPIGPLAPIGDDFTPFGEALQTGVQQTGQFFGFLESLALRGEQLKAMREEMALRRDEQRIEHEARKAQLEAIQKQTDAQNKFALQQLSQQQALGLAKIGAINAEAKARMAATAQAKADAAAARQQAGALAGREFGLKEDLFTFQKEQVSAAASAAEKQRAQDVRNAFITQKAKRAKRPVVMDASGNLSIAKLNADEIRSALLERLTPLLQGLGDLSTAEARTRLQAIAADVTRFRDAQDLEPVDIARALRGVGELNAMRADFPSLVGEIKSGGHAPVLPPPSHRTELGKALQRDVFGIPSPIAAAVRLISPAPGIIRRRGRGLTDADLDEIEARAQRLAGNMPPVLPAEGASFGDPGVLFPGHGLRARLQALLEDMARFRDAQEKGLGRAKPDTDIAPPSGFGVTLPGVRRDLLGFPDMFPDVRTEEQKRLVALGEDPIAPSLSLAGSEGNGALAGIEGNGALTDERRQALEALLEQVQPVSGSLAGNMPPVDPLRQIVDGRSVVSGALDTVSGSLAGNMPPVDPLQQIVDGRSVVSGVVGDRLTEELQSLLRALAEEKRLRPKRRRPLWYSLTEEKRR